MSKIIRFLLLAFCTANLIAAQELKRPTSDMSAAITAVGCIATNTPSGSFPLGYDAAGVTTSSTAAVTGTKTVGRYIERIFQTWQTTTNVFGNLVLNVNYSFTYTFTSGSSGHACIAYTVDNGANWISIDCVDSTSQTQHTDIIPLSPTQNLSLLKVGICAESDAGGDTTGDLMRMTVFDIWTVGSNPAPPPAGNGSGPGPQRPSAVIVTRLFRKSDFEIVA